MVYSENIHNFDTKLISNERSKLSRREMKLTILVPSYEGTILHDIMLPICCLPSLSIIWILHWYLHHLLLIRQDITHGKITLTFVPSYLLIILLAENHLPPEYYSYVFIRNYDILMINLYELHIKLGLLNICPPVINLLVRRRSRPAFCLGPAVIQRAFETETNCRRFHRKSELYFALRGNW